MFTMLSMLDDCYKHSVAEFCFWYLMNNVTIQFNMLLMAFCLNYCWQSGHAERKYFPILPTGLCFKEVKSFVPFPRRDSKRKNTLTMSP